MEHKKLERTAMTLNTIAKVGGGIFRVVGIVCCVFALLVLILRDLAQRNLPLIGDMLAQIVNVVQRQLE